MEQFVLGLLVFRIIISVLGFFGNTVLIIYISQMKQIKTFEVFLVGLAASNLELIIIEAIFDFIIQHSGFHISVWSCRTLKFLTIVGEVGSILFTVIISIYRYQKLRDVATRVNLPTLMDSIRVAVGFSGLCAFLSVLLSAPTYVMNLDGHVSNYSTGGCQADFFQCLEHNCPTLNLAYKYLFILSCNILPLAIISGTSIFIIRILLKQQRAIGSRKDANNPKQQRLKNSGFHRSTVAVLTSMGVFQVNWSLYLVLQFCFSPYTLTGWNELQFLLTTAYSTVSPYVYGIGNNFFSFKATKSSCLPFSVSR